MSLSRYWPESAQVRDCIRTEAETVDEAILLAVHEPTRIFKRSAAGAVIEDKTEQDLLDALLRDNRDGSAVVVSLTGPSGVGKSHMVRWLHAQLARHQRRDQLVVILIPKTASLRQVVELILEPLKGAEYEELRSGLSAAIASISTEDARAWLATELGLQLKRKASDWIAALQAGGDPALKSKAFHAKNMEALLGDHVFREGMLNLALERIVNRAVMGEKTGSSHLPQFEVGDFVWNSSSPITDATRLAQQYYQRLCDNNGEARAIAVDVVNSVIDPAMRAVFRFSHALGTRTIEEIVDAIRVQLLHEKKELVLLIEDFAALSGIQEPLLKLIIAESDDYRGVRVRAPIRTALAVTDGFMPQRDTILTRAQGEWVIASEYANEEELLDRLVEIAGRYLNAARWGREIIRRQFHERTDQSNTGLYGWVQSFRDEHLDATDEDRLKAFGFSRGGFPLFPFNVHALHSLCRKELLVGGKMVFNPRAFINQVLRETLDQRHYYERAAFPPVGFKGGTLPSGAETDLDGMLRPEAEKARLRVMLIHWCGNPRNLHTETPVGAPVFEEFGLLSPFAGVPTAPLRPQSTARSNPSDSSPAPTATAPPPPQVQPPEATAFELAIERWGESKLTQAHAKRVRQLLGAGVAQRLDLGSAMTQKVTSWIWLPYVDHSNPQTPPSFRLAEETGSVPGWIRTALIGLDRCDVNKGWDYSGAEDDYSFAQRLLDQLTPPIERYLHATAQKRLATAMYMAHRQNLMFGIGGVRSLPTAFDRMFEKVGSEYNEADFTSTSDTDRAPILGKVLARALAVRTQLQDLILQDAACFQGAGKIPMAIDHARVAAAWATEPDDANIRVGVSPELAEHLGELGVGFPKLLGHFRVLLANHGGYLGEALGKDFDKEAWIDTIRQALSAAHAQGYVPTDFGGAQDFALLDYLAKSALTELARSVQAVKELAADASPEEQLRAYGRVDLALLLRSTRAIRRLQTLLDAVDRNMTGAEQQARRDEVGEVRATFISELQDAATLLMGEIE
jgi:hypothetical protein